MLAIVFLVPLLPFAIKNATSVEKITSYGTFLYGKSTTPIIKLNKNDPDGEDPYKSIRDIPEFKTLNQNSSTNGSLELSRYLGDKKPAILNYLYLPFSETLNSNVAGQYVDIGFLFLAFIPLLLILFKKIRNDSKKNLVLLYEVLAVGIIFWLMWVFFAQGIIWYGFIGFSFLLIVLVEILDSIIKRKRWALSAIVGFIIVVWFVSTLILDLSYSPGLAQSVSPIALSYARGSIDETEYISKYIGGYSVIRKINDEIDGSKNPPKIYVIGKYESYFIRDNDKLVLEDQLQTFAMISYDHNDQATIRRMKDAGFKYIIVSASQGFTSGEFADQFNQHLSDLFKLFQNNPSDFKLLSDPAKGKTVVVEIL
jgi:hypothetical protein